MQFSGDGLSYERLQVAAFYCFTTLEEDVISFYLEHLTNLAEEGEVKGSILLAIEGLNGTICGPTKAVTSFLEELQKLVDQKALQVKISWSPKQAFRRFKARRKNEIVTMGVVGINPLDSVGVYVEPTDWNDYLLDPDTLVVDTRNNYEVSIGTFKGAINPHTATFREFPSWTDENLHALVEDSSPGRIAMFCTGGIRCEKATSYLLKEGFKEVHHLHGGILRYLEEVPEEESLWDGECFVFDQRVALNHKLLPGIHRLCHACGMPLSPEDRELSSYIHGVQCSYCEDRYTEQDRARFAERQRQIDQSSGYLSEHLPRTNA